MKKSGPLILQSNGMSSIAASFTSTQNGLEKWKLERELQQIECEESFIRTNKGKEIHELKDLALKYLATGCVFKQHRFEKYDPFRKEEKVRQDRRQLQSQRCNQKSVSGKKTNEKRIIISPRLHRSKTMIDEIVHKEKTPSCGRVHTSLPDISKPLEMIAIDTDCREKDVLDQMRSKSVSECDDENNTQIKMSACLLPTIKRVALWEQSSKDHKEEEKKERIRHKKYQPNLKEEFKMMFPGNCKTTYSMRKFIDKETKNVIRDIDTIPRKRNSKEQEHLIKKSQLPEFIDRNKTTSAILRDFRSIKKSLNDDNKFEKKIGKDDNYSHVLRFLELAESFED
ncbi:uncharacterized protein LOC133195225 [Saccostrea echinata]|uniref:uncharacterized protein LOC133195225 n=1 Tax=Saccostrea echinata TaxID=191078 RepID=UPI002A7F164C|nr:uncharacterized protein LOC133195225 [Saccostrea echinata]